LVVQLRGRKFAEGEKIRTTSRKPLTTPHMRKPKTTEYAEFYQTYVNYVQKGNITTIHKKSFKECSDAFAAIPEHHADFAYAAGKWTIKQLLIHLIDTDRVFAYRAMCFMRGERAALPGFMQDQYVENAQLAGRTIKDLLAEWKAVHQNTMFLLKQCTPEVEGNVGKASNWPITPRALFYIIPGHRLHHLSVLRTQYLPLM
jgi:DinB superfamily